MIPTGPIKSRIKFCEAVIAQMIDAEADKRTPKDTLIHIRRTMDGYNRECLALEKELHLIEKLNLEEVEG